MTRLSRSQQNTSFNCKHCNQLVLPLSNGSFRNHCPFCLHSLHVDIMPGDRQSACGGLMVPQGLVKAKKGIQIVHECQVCKARGRNLVAEFTEQPDSVEELAKLKWL